MKNPDKKKMLTICRYQYARLVGKTSAKDKKGIVAEIDKGLIIPSDCYKCTRLKSLQAIQLHT